MFENLFHQNFVELFLIDVKVFLQVNKKGESVWVAFLERFFSLVACSANALIYFVFMILLTNETLLVILRARLL